MYISESTEIRTKYATVVKLPVKLETECFYLKRWKATSVFCPFSLDLSHILFKEVI